MAMMPTIMPTPTIRQSICGIDTHRLGEGEVGGTTLRQAHGPQVVELTIDPVDAIVEPAALLLKPTHLVDRGGRG